MDSPELTVAVEMAKWGELMSELGGTSALVGPHGRDPEATATTVRIRDDEAPPVVSDHRNAPVNSLGYLRVMFTVDDLDETLARLRHHGAELVSNEVVQYEDSYRLCYVRGPGGLLIGLAQELG